MTDAERKRMQAEINELQKTVSVSIRRAELCNVDLFLNKNCLNIVFHFQSLRRQHKTAPPPEETIGKLMLNQVF